MYLVLTAMLALNVSAEIINGFSKIRHSMESSIESTTLRTEDALAVFETAYSKDEAGRAKYGEWWAVAQAIHQESEDFYNYIENFKLDIARMVDGEKEVGDKVPAKLKGGSDTNKPHAYALNEYGESGKTHAEELKDRINAYREFMTTNNSECIRRKMSDSKFAHDLEMKQQMFAALFNTEDETSQEGGVETWENVVFHEMPAAAVLAVLTKYQNDIRVAENDMVNFMFTAAGSSDFVINQINAFVMPLKSDFVTQGQNYEARIVSGGVDTLNLPQVFINGQEVPGGIYRAAGNTVGEHKFSGYIMMPGDTVRRPFEHSFFVSPRTAVIANTDLDMMYSGYENPISISVPGYALHQLSIVCEGAQITKNDAGWVVNPREGKTSTIQVYATADGKRELMGEKTFRTPRLPKPRAYFFVGSKMQEGETIAKNVLTSGAASVQASYDADSPIKAKFDIVSYAIKLPNGKRIEVKGSRFSTEALNAVKTMKLGADIKVMDIKAKEPNGKIRTLDPIVAELK